MMLDDGFADVPAGRIAAVVTHLEMREPARLRAEHVAGELSLHHIKRPEAAWYRQLYAYVGGHDWLWFSRLKLDDRALEDIIRDPLVEIYALRHGEANEGLLEPGFSRKARLRTRLLRRVAKAARIWRRPLPDEPRD